MTDSHNALIQRINREIAASIAYEGITLDLGCGNAPYREQILKTASQYIGMDWPSSLHGQSNVSAFANASNAVPVASGSVDTVTSFQVMEHLPEPQHFLDECYRVLRPGGLLVITVPFMWQVHEAPHDYFRYTRYGLEYLLQKSGFSEILVKENTGYWQTAALKFSYQTRRLARGILRLPVQFFWQFSQAAAVLLDRIDWNPAETASYTVTAKKPFTPHPLPLVSASHSVSHSVASFAD